MKKAQPERRTLRGRHRDGGFTFLELIVVIAVLGVMFTLAVIKIHGTIKRYSLRNAAGELGTNIELVRLKAIQQGSLCGIRYHFDDGAGLQGYSLLASGGDQSEISRDAILQGRQGVLFVVFDRINFDHPVELLSVEMRGTGQAFSDGEPDVYFSPAGNTGSHIVVLGTPEGARYTVLYNALTGAVDFVDSDQASFEDFEE